MGKKTVIELTNQSVHGKIKVWHRGQVSIFCQDQADIDRPAMITVFVAISKETPFADSECGHSWGTHRCLGVLTGKFNLINTNQNELIQLAVKL